MPVGCGLLGAVDLGDRTVELDRAYLRQARESLETAIYFVVAAPIFHAQPRVHPDEDVEDIDEAAFTVGLQRVLASLLARAC